MHYIEVTLNNNQPVEKAWIIIMEKSDVKTKPKRVVIKIGDVFCVEFDNRFKCYFQCIAKETDPFECEVIRVFKTRYAMSYVPVAAVRRMSDTTSISVIVFTFSVMA